MKADAMKSITSKELRTMLTIAYGTAATQETIHYVSLENLESSGNKILRQFMVQSSGKY